jgi:hypothetical protein
MDIVFSSYVVRFTDGSVDHDSTLEKFASDLLRFEEIQDKENATVGKAVHALFDQYKGAKLNTPFVIGEVLSKLNAQPENYKTLSNKIADFLKSQSQGDNSTFVVSKGKGGGIGRRIDLK